MPCCKLSTTTTPDSADPGQRRAQSWEEKQRKFQGEVEKWRRVSETMAFDDTPRKESVARPRQRQPDGKQIRLRFTLHRCGGRCMPSSHRARYEYVSVVLLLVELC